MLTLNSSYSLEYRVEIKDGLFRKLHISVSVIKLLVLCCLIVAFWVIWTLVAAILLIIVALVVDVYKNKLLYTVRCSVNCGELIVKRIDLDGKEEILEEIKRADIQVCEFVENPPQSSKVYFNESTVDIQNKILHCASDKTDICILSDNYMYSLLCMGDKNDILR